MSYPDKAEALMLLNKWQSMHQKADALVSGVHAVFGSTPDSALFETVWSLFDAYTAALSAQLGDASDAAHHGKDWETWLSWYCWENAMGAKAAAAGYNGKLKPVKTLGHLYRLIVEGRKGV